MKRMIILIFALVCANTAYTQNNTPKKKIAVYITGSTQDGVIDVVSDRLLEALTKDEKFTVVERADAFLSAVRNEQTYERSGEVDNRQISALGKQFGVDIICIGKITSVLGTNNIAARLVNVETATVIASYSKADPLQNYDALVSVIDGIAKNLLNGLSQKNKMVVGQSYQGGIIAQINETGEHGLIITKQDVGLTLLTWDEANQKCNDLIIDGYDDWRLPSEQELNNFDATKLGISSPYWSSREIITPKNSNNLDLLNNARMDAERAMEDCGRGKVAHLVVIPHSFWQSQSRAPFWGCIDSKYAVRAVRNF